MFGVRRVINSSSMIIVAVGIDIGTGVVIISIVIKIVEGDHQLLTSVILSSITRDIVLCRVSSRFIAIKQ